MLMHSTVVLFLNQLRAVADMMSHWPCKEGHYLQNHRIPIKIRTVSQTLFVFYNFGIFEAKFHELSLGLLCPHDQIQVII